MTLLQAQSYFYIFVALGVPLFIVAVYLEFSATVICSWCGKHMGYKWTGKKNSRTSHGMCRECDRNDATRRKG